LNQATNHRIGRIRTFSIALWLALAAAIVPSAGRAQGGGSPVGVTEAIRHGVHQTLELTGSVESRRAGLVASEAEGVVTELVAREGERVRKGQPLVRLRQEVAEFRLKAAQGQLQEARAQLRLAETNQRRAQELFDQQVFSRQQLDDALSQQDAGEGRVAQLEAEVARLEDQLAHTVVRAPYDAVVVAEHCSVGEWVGAGDPVAELVDTGDLEVTLQVPEQFFSGLVVGAPVRVTIGSLGRSDFEARIRAVVPRADPQARSFPLKVAISNPKGAIGVGMLARIAVPVGGAEPATLVPKDALVSKGGNRFVFVVGEEDKVRSVQVTPGTATGNWIAVRGEIAAGDRVVIQGNERLAPGQPVRPEAVEVTLP
jgi:RND family efflux transporter MFP subunit